MNEYLGHDRAKRAKMRLASQPLEILPHGSSKSYKTEAVEWTGKLNHKENASGSSSTVINLGRVFQIGWLRF